jgi:hypothetical protein
MVGARRPRSPQRTGISSHPVVTGAPGHVSRDLNQSLRAARDRGRVFQSHRKRASIPAMGLLRLRRERPPVLDEQTAYTRCHGDRDQSVRIVKLPPRRSRDADVLAIGESIRVRFEERLELRVVEADESVAATQPS